MIKTDKTHYKVIAKLLADCFLEDQLVQSQIKGIENPDKFLEKLFLSQMSVLNHTCEIHSLDKEFQSILVGYEKKKHRLLREIVLSILCQLRISKYMTSDELKIFAQNSKESRNNIDLNWHKEFVKGNYYYIKVIAIAKECRGKGAFRKLISPIIHLSREKDIPIVLETNTPENIPIYQHFGFELVRTIPGSAVDFCQYCFIKRPEQEVKI